MTSSLRHTRSLVLVLAALVVASGAAAQTLLWRPAPDMQQTRSAPESVTLNDGRVLVVGSAGFTVAPEVYNPTTNTWAYTGAIADPTRVGHRMGKLGDGRVIVVGGTACCVNGQNVSTTSTQILNPATGVWTAAASTSIGHSDPGFTVLQDGRVFVSGGASHPNHTNLNPIATTEIYDSTTNTWTTVAPMAVARNNHLQVQLNDGRIMVMGGDNTFGSLTETTELYDLNTGVWVAGPPMKRARRDFTVNKLADGRVLVIGGVARNPSNFFNIGGGDTAEIFDPSTNTWTLIAQTMSVVRREHTATLMYDGRVLVAGGNNGGVPYQTAELLDPETGTWQLSTMITRRMFHSASLLLDGRVLVAGGWNQDPFYTNKAELYGDPLPPSANAGTDQTLSGCVGCFTQASLDGSASAGTGGQAITSYVWSEGATTLASSSQTTAIGLFGVGTHIVTLTITQQDGQTDSDTVTITVVDAIAARDAMIAQLQDQLQQKQSLLDGANATIGDLNNQITGLQGQVTGLTNQVNELTTEVSSLTGERDSLQTQLNTANGRIGELENQVATLTTENTALSDLNQSLQGQVTSLTTANQTLQGQVNTLTLENQNLQTQVTSLTSLNQQLSAQLAIANQAVATCQSSLDSLNQAIGTSLTGLTAEFRTTFRDPSFVIPGATPLAQMQGVFNVVIGLKKADQKPIYKGLGGNRND